MEARESLASIAIAEAAERLRGVVRRTPLESWAPPEGADPRIDLRLKLECLQETGAFKARGAWNNVSQLTDEQREAGVVAASSGNHGRALAWAAQRAGVRATICMPEDAYPNKIQACRDHGAEVLLAPSRAATEDVVAELVAQGATLVHPYDAVNTIEGAGTVGLEIAEDWPDVEVVVIPVGGGGLIAGSSLALHTMLGEEVVVIGAEPVGAPNLGDALQAGRPVVLHEITTKVQGLCPMALGDLNYAVVDDHVTGVVHLDDEEIYAAQGELVRAGWVVEPAGAAAVAAVLTGGLPDDLLEGRSAEDPVRICCVVSGGNPDPAQLESLR